MRGKITVKNFTTLTDFSALCRASLYLAGRKDEATENGIMIKVSETRRGGTTVKITEKEPAGMTAPADSKNEYASAL